MEKILTVLLTFILTGVIGNAIARRWQNRQWVNQQRVLGFEKEFVALKELVDEIGRLLGARIYHSQRLTLSLRSTDAEAIARRVKDYEEAVKQWNEKLGSFYVRLPYLAETGLGLEVERSIQDRLVVISKRLDRLLEQRKSGIPPKNDVDALMIDLNSIQGRAIALNKKLFSTIGSRRDRIYVGTKIPYRRDTLREYSNWELVKALFVSSVDTHTVHRSPLDS